jgi:hypothetical protein
MVKLEVTQVDDIFIYNFVDNDGTSKSLKFKKETHEAIEAYYKKPKKEKKKPATAPTLQEVKDYFKQEGYQEDVAVRFHKYYEALDWYDNLGKPVLRWKGKAISSWMKPEAKLKVEVKNTSSFFQK